MAATISKSPTRNRVKAVRSRRRLDQINEASKRCRRRQKEELHFLRERVAELEKKLEKHQDDAKKQDETVHHEVVIHDNQTALDSEEAFLYMNTSLIPWFNLFQLYQGYIRNSPSEFMRLHEAELRDRIVFNRKSPELMAISSQLKVRVELMKRTFRPSMISEPVHSSNDFEIRLHTSKRGLITFTSEFFPNVTPQNVQDAMYFFMSDPSIAEPDKHKVLKKEVFKLSPDDSFIRGWNWGRWSYIAYGRKKLPYNHLVTRWISPSNNECCIALETILNPELMDEASRMESTTWTRFSWISIIPCVSEKGVTGAELRHFHMSGYTDGRLVNPPPLKQGTFRKFLLKSLLDNREVFNKKLSSHPAMQPNVVLDDVKDDL